MLAALALLCIFIAAGTIEPAYSFHMGLAVVAAGLFIFAILQRYTARPADPPLANVAVVAFANKLARIAWAVLRRGKRFAATGMPAA